MAKRGKHELLSKRSNKRFQGIEKIIKHRSLFRQTEEFGKMSNTCYIIPYLRRRNIYVKDDFFTFVYMFYFIIIALPYFITF